MSSSVHGASAELIGEVVRRAGGVGCHYRGGYKVMRLWGYEVIVLPRRGYGWLPVASVACVAQP